MAVLLCADLYLVGREWHSFARGVPADVHAAAGSSTTAIALSLAKVVHELGHAYAAKRYGVRVPAMGVAFMVMSPYLYTDTGETWKLVDRRKQMIIASAGMAAELSLAVFATLLWALSPEGAREERAVRARHLHLADDAGDQRAARSCASTAISCCRTTSTFPNLHERGTACARWWLRTTIFGLQEPMPEPALAAAARRWLIAFALVTWIYRLVVFFGIALLVYHMFFKLLGIFLMLLELVWFIARPIWNETAYLWAQRSKRPRRLAPRAARRWWSARSRVWMVPVTNEVIAPGILPRLAGAGGLRAVCRRAWCRSRCRRAQKVSAGELLIDLDAQELKVRGHKADVSIASARTELARTPASVRQQERSGVLETELAEALASRQAVFEEAERRAAARHAGRHGTRRGPRPGSRPLGQPQAAAHANRLRSGAHDRGSSSASARSARSSPGRRCSFYPSVPNHPVVRGTLVAVDKSPLKELPQPLLASVYGGDIAVKPTGKATR